ncbi:hypothetical protein ABI59_11895 [Acidobacteria bacterium Mor1]|nr:hypothetical protein ABI59_11895 [Acidobacteria bacterium Mor1]
MAQVLRPLADMFDPEAFPDLLSGLSTPDDAAVWRLDDTRALVLTTDFFPPVVDDPHAFGSIAAANALSDLFAMGARPLFALNLVGFPDDLPESILSEILRGGGEKVREAGAVIAGGHTTTDQEPKYGLAALGLVDPQRVWTKGGALDGDRLLLTKPLGSGLITTAHRADSVDGASLDAAIASMSRLNGNAARILGEAEGAVHACTDITGYSLMGHGFEMASQSSLKLRMHFDRLPLLEGARDCAEQGRIPGGTRRNAEAFRDRVRLAADTAEWQKALLFDPQTSGGLFAAVSADAAGEIERAFRAAGEPIWWVGEAIAGPAGIEVA